MKIELCGISLSEVQSREGGAAEARSVSPVRTTDNRNIVAHTVPGMEGSAIQDLGRTAVHISFDGTVIGASARHIVEMLRSKFKLGEPVAFNSDVSGTTDVSEVVIEEFRVINVAGNKDRYDYTLRLKEYNEPPQRSTSLSSQDEEAEAWAEGEAEASEQSVYTETEGSDETPHEAGATAAGGSGEEVGQSRTRDIPPPDEKSIKEDTTTPITPKPVQPASTPREKKK